MGLDSFVYSLRAPPPSSTIPSQPGVFYYLILIGPAQMCRLHRKSRQLNQDIFVVPFLVRGYAFLILSVYNIP